MQRLLASRGVFAAAAGILVLLAIGGGYAFAGSQTKTIRACVHKHGGAMYMAKKCHRHDKKISWNQAGRQGVPGPAGPGATGLNFTMSGSTSPSPTAIGTLGPFTLTGECKEDTSSSPATDDFTVTYSGPAVSIDGFALESDSASSTPAFVSAASASLPATSNGIFSEAGSSSGQLASSGQLLVVPAGATPVQIFETSVSNGANSPNPNTCHISGTVIPVSGISSAAAADSAHVATSKTSKLSGPLFGKH